MTIRQGVDVDKAMMLAKFRVSRFTLSASSGGSIAISFLQSGQGRRTSWACGK